MPLIIDESRLKGKIVKQTDNIVYVESATTGKVYKMSMPHSYYLDYYHKNKHMISCPECGKRILNISLNRHRKTKNCKLYSEINKNNNNKVDDNKVDENKVDDNNINQTPQTVDNGFLMSLLLRTFAKSIEEENEENK
jgi:DNA-directed RNA polymerase subunit M/transcription elongation factor TFIIS